MKTMPEIIEVKDLFKNYGDISALKGVSLSISAGQIYGILGPNGSGKTTLLRIIGALLEPSSGYISVNGLSASRDKEKIKSLIGYVPETPILYESLTPSEYFAFVGSVREIEGQTLKNRVVNFVDAFGINDYMNDFIGSLSFGTKQKVAIISAFLHDPEIIIMDEGMNGLDPRTAKILKDLLLNFAAEGKTVIFSTHVMEVAESVCHTISILYNGNIAGTGTLKELRQSAGSSDSKLEDIFLKLTGNEDLSPIINSLRESLKA